jgi:hypothetical protein
MTKITRRSAEASREGGRTGPVLLLLVFALLAPLAAHHSHGNYNMTEYTILNGVVREVHWINPHTWIYIEVKDAKGEPTMWALEGASVVQVERRGWRKDMIKVGSTIGVRCHQLRDGSSGCLLGFITLEGAAEKMFD